MAAKAFYEFGSYRLDLPTRRLLRDATPVPLPPKAFDTLVVLIERRDRVVDKAELMGLLWPDSFVDEANLSQTVFVLRKVLGETPDGRQFIDTVPRRGYRFAGKASEDGQPTITEGERAPTVDTPRSPTRAAVLITLGLLVVTTTLTWWWTANATHRPEAGSRTPSRVVVLPFENLTRDPADDWLSAAFSESLTLKLQDLDDLIVVDRDRIAELYRQQSVAEASPLDSEALRRVATTLSARYYVHGSYQKLGDRLRVMARLVDRESSEIRTQKGMTGKFSDVLQLQDDLAHEFAIGLEARRAAPPARTETSSIEAYQAFMEGRRLHAASKHPDAIQRFDRAIELDARYAQAWAWRGKSYARMSAPAMFGNGSLSENRRQALASARRSVALDDKLYDGHTAMALAYRETEQIGPWREEAARAIELNPRIAEAHELLADSYFAAPAWGCRRERNPALAEDSFRKAIEIEPRYQIAYTNLVYHHVHQAEPQRALQVADDALRRLSDLPSLLRARAYAFVWLDRLDDAEKDVLAVTARNPISAQDAVTLGSVELKRGRTESADAHFKRALTLQPIANFHMTIGERYLDVNDFDRGLSMIGRAFQLEPACVGYIARAPLYQRFRANPRFATLLSHHGFP